MTSPHHRTLLVLATLALLLCGCRPRGSSSAAATTPDLRAERAAHATQLTRKEGGNGSFDQPPKGVFDLIYYAGADGPLGAYLSPDPGDGKKHPLVIWLVGGFDNSISSTFWDDEAPVDNDQSASAYRNAGLPMMFPSLRGGNDNPGVREFLYGEVDDVLAAVRYAKSLNWVDPARIYLGGHSSGAGLALLAAECADPGELRAVIAVGPVADMAAVGQKRLPFNLNDAREARLRSPVEYLPRISARTLIVEGDDGDTYSLNKLRERNRNSLLSFTLAQGYNHFSVLAPVNQVLAGKIAADTGPEPQLGITSGEIKAAGKTIADEKRIPTGDVRADIAQSGIVLYHSSNTETLTAAIRSSLAVDAELKRMPVYSSFSEAKEPPFIVIEQEQAPFSNFTLPEEKSFKYVSVGMGAPDIAAVLHSTAAASVYWVVDTPRAWAVAKKLNTLAKDWAEPAGAYLWDTPTRQCFTPQSWRRIRIDGWGDGEIPDIRSQIHLHLYQQEEGKPEVRIITLGMAKFGLPDVVLPDSSSSRSNDSGNLVNLVCQTLAFRPVIADPEHFTVDTSALQPASLVHSYREIQASNATGRATLSLLKGSPEEGDEDNRQIVLTFTHGEGATPAEKYSATLSSLWGADDEAFQVKQDAALEKASREARDRLKKLAPEFSSGIPQLTELLVKAPFKLEDGEGTEWMWVEVQSWNPGELIKGLLQNEPSQIHSLRRGAKVTVNPDEVYDYLLTRPDGTEEGNETRRLLEMQKGKQ